MIADGLPPSVRSALDIGTSAVMRAIQELERHDHQLGTMTLWVLSEAGYDPEFARILAIRVAGSDRGEELACRLWLMDMRQNDLGVANTMLGGLKREAVEQQAWPPVLGSVLFDFLRSCLRHRELSVRAGVLSLFALAEPRGLLSRTFPPVLANALAKDLEVSLTGQIDDEEQEDLRVVTALLRRGANAQSLPAGPPVLARTILDLVELSERLSPALQGLEPLVSYVRRRALLDDAGVRAARSGQPIQTFRVIGDVASTKIVQAMVALVESVVAATRQPEFVDADAPDYGTSLAWAPAASVPMHLLCENDDARQAFDVLASLAGAARSRVSLRGLFEQLDPSVAEAVLRLIARLKQHDGQVEIVLTDPGQADWQRTVVLGPDILGEESIASLARRSRAAASGRSIVVHREHVPQANTVRQVYEAMDAMLMRGIVTADDISDVNNSRQVNYYNHGARILGLLDADNRPTGRARALIGLSYEQRLALTAVYFEDAPVCRAWREWAGRDRLSDVDPQTAAEFLKACVVGLSGTTPGRRASTLRRWFSELMSHYPGHDPTKVRVGASVPVQQVLAIPTKATRGDRQPKVRRRRATRET